MDSLPIYLQTIFVVFLFSAFVKIVTTLSILRYGLGLRGSGFGAAVWILSFVTAVFVMAPQMQGIGGVESILMGRLDADAAEVLDASRPFLLKHSDPELLKRLERLSPRSDHGAAAQIKPDSISEQVDQQEEVQLPVLIVSFLVTELRDAFRLGFVILVPFLVIDLLVVNVLMVLGVTQLSVAVVALPLKILLFVAVNGWELVIEKLIASY